MLTKTVAALALVAGGLAGSLVTAPPAEADTVSILTTSAICQYGRPNANWAIHAYQTVHYGAAHVTQCAYVSTLVPGGVLCRQYVWNIPSPYWDYYSPPRSTSPYCW